MKHIIENKELGSTVIIDETLCENTSIKIIESDGNESTHYFTPINLKSFIGALLHVQAKKRKEGNDFNNLSNKF